MAASKRGHTRWITVSLTGSGQFTVRFAEAPHGRSLTQNLEPDRSGWAEDLGPDWREAIGALVADVLVDRVQSA